MDAGGVLYLNNNGIGYTNPSLLEFIKSNQDKYIFGIISTTNYDLKDIVQKDGMSSLFKLILTSGETGIDKTNPEIYKIALDRLNIKPEETIFIDNQKDYLNIASSLDIKTILYDGNLDKNFDSCKKQIESM